MNFVQAWLLRTLGLFAAIEQAIAEISLKAVRKELRMTLGVEWKVMKGEEDDSSRLLI